MRRSILSLSWAGLIAVACSGAARENQPPESVSRQQTPAQSASASQTGEQAAPAERALVSPPLDLENFRPLLAEPQLQEVRLLYETDEIAQAVRLLSEQSAQETDALRQAQYAFVIGRLHLEAGELLEAQQAFEKSSSFAWLLAPDAALRAAEIAVKRESLEGLTPLLQRASSLAGELRYELLLARVRVREGKFQEALSLYQKILSQKEEFSVRLEFVRFLGERGRSTTEPAERKQWAQWGLAELALLRVGLPSSRSLAGELRTLEQQFQEWSGGSVAELEAEEKLAHLRGLVESQAWEDAAAFLGTLEFGPRDFSTLRCETDFWAGRMLSQQRKWGEAADRLAAAAERCTQDPGLHARLLFNAGRFAAADGRSAKAVAYFAQLEKLYPENSLADDARLRAAHSYKKMGAPARFIDLLTRLPEDYPEGDMTMEGVLDLALYRIERKDWAGAALILERGASIVRSRDAARGHEFSGCERYFLARSYGELGQKQRELDEYESIVRELPLSYYMLHAYSRLHAADAERATRVLEEARAQAREKPFSFPHRKEFESPTFLRALELLRVSELQEGKKLLGQLGLLDGSDQSVLWGMALLYDRAGDARFSHSIARGRLSDWLSHYPEGDWEQPWQIGFPRPYLALVEKESRATGVPAWLIYGVMREESTFDPQAESPAAAYGLMQLIVPTARALGKKAGLPHSPQALKRPAVNIALGSLMLQNLARQFRLNPWLAIPGYNAGPGRPARWLRERPDMDFDVWVEMIPFRETRRYTKRVLASRAAYAFLYHPEEVQEALLLPERLKLPTPG